MVDAIESECECYLDDSGRRQLKNPYVALKLGHSLLHLANLKNGQAIRDSDENALKQVDDRNTLYCTNDSHKP